MEFQETLLAAQRNQQQKSSAGNFYKARFDPPKKEQKSRDKLSANIQKFLAKKEEEERQKKLEVVKKRDELMAMRDPKAIRKIQKSLKVFKSANKSVLVDAIDHEHTALTREGPEQADQDDYGYESQEAAAIYQKMMEKYSKIPDEPKYPNSGSKVKKDLNGIRERVKHTLQHEDDPVPHKRKRKSEHEDKEPSPPPKSEQDKKKDEKPKIRKPMPPPMDFNSLLKLAEQKKSDPLEVIAKKPEKSESEPGRLMTKKQRKEYEEEMARRMRRQERLAAAASGNKKVVKTENSERVRSVSKERKPETLGFGRIPKIGEKPSTSNKPDKNDSPRSSHKDKIQLEMEKIEKLQKEKAKLDKERMERDKERLDLERLEKLKAERERIERDIERLNKDKDRLEKTKIKLESSGSKVEKSLDSKVKSQSIDLKSQNTYRIDKNSNEKKSSISCKSSDFKQINGQSSHSKPMGQINKNGIKDKGLPQKNESQKPNGLSTKSDPNRSLPMKGKDGKHIAASKAGDKPKNSNSFDFDKHMSSFKNRAEGESRHLQPGQVKRKMNPDDKKKIMQKRRVVDSESEYDSEMDDFIDDRDEDLDYSKHIKEIFGYDKSRYRDMDDDDDPTMESSFSRQMREEYISKKIGIMEDLEDIKMERKMKKKNKRRISDD